MLSIKNLHASVEGNTILNGINLDIKSGEVHAIMGPNGAGKSTLGYVITGREGYSVEQGSVTLDGVELLGLEAEQRALAVCFWPFSIQLKSPVLAILNL